MLAGRGLAGLELSSCLSFGQVPDKSGGLIRPPAAHFGAQNNQSGAAVPTVELRVSGLLPPPCCGEGCAADVSATGVGIPIQTKWRHHGGVHGKLGAMEQGQPVTTTSILRSSNRLVTAADSRANPATHGARCMVVATGIEWTATPAGTTGRG